jgi:hypothetical protein
MEENKEQTQPELIETQHPQESISLGDALAGVFSEPGETFSSVKNSAKKNYWLIPLIIVIVVSIISSFLVMRDEELVSSIKDKQKIAMKEQFDKAVKEGKMTREQANEQMEQSEKMFTGSMFMIFGLIGSVFGVLILFFLKALLYWGGLKIFKGSAGYVDIMNVLGLAGIITAIQLIVDTVLAIVMGKLMMNIGPVLLFSEEAVGKQVYTLLANFDLINIWYLIVVSIGLAKVSNLKNSATIPFVFGLWIVWILLTSFGPLGMFVGR